MFRIFLNQIGKKPKTLIVTSNNGGYINNNNNKQQQNIFNLNLFGVSSDGNSNNGEITALTYFTRSSYKNFRLNYSTSSSSSPSKSTPTTTPLTSPTKKKKSTLKKSTSSSVLRESKSTPKLLLTNNPDVKIVIKQIENEPTKIEHFKKLSELLGPKGRAFLLGKEMGQKEILLEMLNLDPTQPYIHYFLYVWLTEMEDYEEFESVDNDTTTTTTTTTTELLPETITLLNGTTYTFKELLIKEIELNPQFTMSYIKLTNYQKSMLDDRITIPIATLGNGVSNFGLNKLEMFLKVLDIEPDNKIAMYHLSTFLVVNKFNEIQMMNGEQLTTYQIISKNYQLNKLVTPFASIYLSEHIETTPQQAIKILSDAITQFPYEHKLYLKLADKLVNNYDMVIIGNGVSLNRLQLLGISISSQEQYLKDNNIKEIPIGLSEFYFKLGNYLDNRIVTINDISSSNNKVIWNKISLYIKSLQINPLNLECKKSLIQSITNKEIVLINNKSYSKLDLLFSMIENSKQTSNSDYYKFIYSSLSNYYKDNNQDQFNKFNNLLKKEIENRKLELIKLIDNFSLYGEYYSLLYLEMDKDEKVKLKGISMNRIDVLLKAIHLSPKRVMLHYQLSEELPNSESTITLLDGTIITKQELLLKESQINPNYSNIYYSLSSLIGEDDISNKIQFLSVALSLNTKSSSLYLELGLLMYKYSIDSLQLSRKQMFIKSLEQEDPCDPLNGKNPLTWYHLALEMNEEETQFNLTKKEILSMIIDNLDPNFTLAKLELEKSNNYLIDSSSVQI